MMKKIEDDLATLSKFKSIYSSLNDLTPSDTDLTGIGYGCILGALGGYISGSSKMYTGCTSMADVGSPTLSRIYQYLNTLSPSYKDYYLDVKFNIIYESHDVWSTSKNLGYGKAAMALIGNKILKMVSNKNSEVDTYTKSSFSQVISNYFNFNGLTVEQIGRMDAAYYLNSSYGFFIRLDTDPAPQVSESSTYKVDPTSVYGRLVYEGANLYSLSEGPAIFNVLYSKYTSSSWIWGPKFSAINSYYYTNVLLGWESWYSALFGCTINIFFIYPKNLLHFQDSKCIL